MNHVLLLDTPYHQSTHVMLGEVSWRPARTRVSLTHGVMEDGVFKAQGSLPWRFLKDHPADIDSTLVSHGLLAVLQVLAESDGPCAGTVIELT